jgi:uncharacterized membrane protein YccC
MNTAALAGRGRPFSPESLRYGARLAGAVLLAFAASALLRLPEGFWAVMSALIVVRPDTGSTLGAGWDRVRGALLGTALGLAGTALRHVEGLAEIAPLALVTVLAFGAGLSPLLRSAPISALIVVTSGSIPGHTAGQVALLRALEIGIGVAAALLVSLLDARSRATLRYRAAAAAQLRALADSLLQEPAPDARDAAELARRAALRQLAVLADAADREARVFAGKRRRGVDDRHRRSARLLARTASDAALFARLRRMSAGTLPPAGDAPERAAADSLRAVADALEQQRPLAFSTLALAGVDAAAAGDRRIALQLLEGDLDALTRLEALRLEAPPSRPAPTRP